MVSPTEDEHRSLLGHEDRPHRDLDSIVAEPRFLAKLCATSFNYFVSGLAVTAVGALIPSLESYYGITDSKVSAIFPSTLGGYLCSTMSIHFVHLRLGRRGLGWLSSLLRIVAYAALSFGPPFQVCLVAYCILGYGTGLTDSGWSAWASGLRYSSVVQGPLHGSFGIGCITGPLLAVSFIAHGYSWTDVYRLLVLLAVFELFVQLWAFWNDSARVFQDTTEQERVISEAIGHHTTGDHLADSLDSSASAHRSTSCSPFLYRGTYMCSLFFFVYVSIEYTYSDWIVVYMRRVRHVPYATAGLASSVFWLGQAVGRVGLGPVSEYFGVKRAVSVYLCLCAVTQVLFKAATASPVVMLFVLGLNGIAIAPTFPSGLVLLSNAVPKQAQVRAVSVAAAVGQVGGATVPFIIGFMAERAGINRLLDVVLCLTILLIALWLIYSRTC